ncbi:MAG: ABC transporter permease [Betaproteobacteria bacterium]
MNAFIALVRKDLRLYFSNRRALIITFAAPIFIAAFFGSLFGSGGGKISQVPIAVVDSDNSAVSKQIVAGLKADTALNVQELDSNAALALVKTGKLRAAVVLPPRFGQDASRAMFRPGDKPKVSIHFDPSQSMVMPMVRGMLAQHVMKAVSQSAFSADSSTMAELRTEVGASDSLPADEKRDLVSLFESVERVQKRSATSTANAPGKAQAVAPGFDMPFTTESHEVTSNRERRYNSYSHSFGGMSVQFIMFMGIDIGIGLLLARRMGLWKRLRAAPVSRTLLLGSTVASAALIAMILMLGIFAAGMLFFGVRIEGSAPGFIGIVMSFSLMAATFGLLLAAIGNSPEATRGLAIFATLLMVMLGGAWVPSFVFPEWLQTASLFVPTRWAIDGLAAMTWRGLGFEAALAPMAVLLGTSALLFAVAIWRFKWEE